MKLRTQQNNLNNVRIQDSCLLVKVTVKKFGNSRQDKEASLKAADDHNASTDVVKVNKKLLNSPVISALSKVQGQITNGPVSVFTLPWEEKSWRLIERNVIQKFEGKLKEHFDKFEEYKSELEKDIDKVLERARQDLGDLFRESDFPSKQEIVDAYSISVEYRGLSRDNTNDVRFGPSPEWVQAQQEQAEKLTEQRIQRSLETVHNTVIDSLDHLIDRLNAHGVKKAGGTRKQSFNDSMIDQLNTLAEILPSLNITGDARLTRASNELLTKLSGLDPNELRENKSLRESVAKTAEQIKDDLTGGFFD